jgi:hypothetical protein
MEHRGRIVYFEHRNACCGLRLKYPFINKQSACFPARYAKRYTIFQVLLKPNISRQRMINTKNLEKHTGLRLWWQNCLKTAVVSLQCSMYIHCKISTNFACNVLHALSQTRRQFETFTSLPEKLTQTESALIKIMKWNGPYIVKLLIYILYLPRKLKHLNVVPYTLLVLHWTSFILNYTRLQIWWKRR